MNYEEKYKQALERAKYLKENTDSVGAKDISYNFEYIFPELRESEDERIRKDLITYINSIKGDTLDLTIRAHKWLCWLEKQKEKKQIIAVDSDQLLKILPRTVEWSKEDKKQLDRAIYMMEQLGMTKSWDDVYNWLKSLKPNHWKPSEEQMEALKYFISFHKSQANAAVEGWKEFKNLESLYNDLKKL